MREYERADDTIPEEEPHTQRACGSWKQSYFAVENLRLMEAILFRGEEQGVLMSDKYPDRHEYIGMSELAAALGLSKWKSRREWYLSKVAPAPDEPTGDMERGNTMESVVYDWFESRGVMVCQQQLELRHPDLPIIRAHLDGVICPPSNQAIAALAHVLEGSGAQLYDPQGLLNEPKTGDTFIVEIKCPRTRTLPRYQDEGLPPDYLIQGQGQMRLYELDRKVKPKGIVFVVWDYDNWRPLLMAIPYIEGMADNMFGEAMRAWGCVTRHDLDTLEEMGRLDLPGATSDPVPSDDDMPQMTHDLAAITELEQCPDHLRELYALASNMAYWKRQVNEISEKLNTAGERLEPLMLRLGTKKVNVPVGSVSLVRSKGRTATDSKALMQHVRHLRDLALSDERDKQREALNRLRVLDLGWFQKTGEPSISLRTKPANAAPVRVFNTAEIAWED